MTAGPDTVSMPGQVWGLAAADPAGPLYVTSYAGGGPSTRNLNTTVLTAVDLTGATIWQRSFDGHPFPPRVDADGTVWVAHHDGGSPPGFTFIAVGPDGTVVRSVTPQQEPPEHLGAVVRMPDGFCAVWLPTAPRHRIGNGVARLARHSDTGDTIWSTPLGPRGDLLSRCGRSRGRYQLAGPAQEGLEALHSGRGLSGAVARGR